MRKLMKYCLSLAVCQIIYSSRRRCAKYMCKISNFRITVINLNNFSLHRNLQIFLFSFTTFTVEIFKIYVYFHCLFQVKKYCFLDPCCIYIRYILRDACVHVRYVPLDNFQNLVYMITKQGMSELLNESAFVIGEQLAINRALLANFVLVPGNTNTNEALI